MAYGGSFHEYRDPHSGNGANYQQRERFLKEFINEGINEFSPVVEVIRQHFPDAKFQTKLSTDFIRSDVEISGHTNHQKPI